MSASVCESKKETPVSGDKKELFGIPLGLWVSIGVLAAICLMPCPAGLSRPGLHMLAILCFAVVLWITEAVCLELSALFIIVLTIFLVGTAHTGVDGTGPVFGIGKAMNVATAGFSNSGAIMVSAAVFISVAMVHTGLDKRMAYGIMSKVGTSTRRIIAGLILVLAILAFFVPSGTARAACMLPIVLGLINAFGVDKRSNLAAAFMLVVPHGVQLWNMAVQTATAQNLLVIGYMDTMLGARITWGEWLVAGLPLSILMAVALYFILVFLFPPEMDELPGGKAFIQEQQKAMGPMTPSQKRILLVSLALLFFWMTEKKLHNINSTAVTLAGLALLLCPKIGVISWKELQARAPWGVLVTFGASLGIGSTLVATGAGKWLGQWIVQATNLQSFGAFGIFMILSVFLIVIHIGFASVTAFAAALAPVVIAVLQTIPGVNVIGMTMILTYAISFGFLLPINGTPGMVALATETFTLRQFIKSGVTFTVVSWFFMVIMALFYWPMLGWM